MPNYTGGYQSSQGSFPGRSIGGLESPRSMVNGLEKWGLGILNCLFLEGRFLQVVSRPQYLQVAIV